MENTVPYRDDIPFTIKNVCDLLGLTVRRGNTISAYVDCPFCNYKNGKMNLSFERDTFRCNYCGEYGGKIQLYSRVYGITNSDAYREICDALSINSSNTYVQRQAPRPPAPIIQRPPSADIETVHQTYSYLLSMLTLSKTHKENLMTRGLSEQDIIAGKYKSAPAFGYLKLTKVLTEQGCTVSGVPGFYMDAKGEWTINFKPYLSGIIVPIVSVEGKIRGAQIRLDNPKDPKQKYIWLSSVNEHMGVTSGSPVHFEGNPTDEIVYITEGRIKAHVAHVLSGKSFLAVAGVNSLSLLPPVLKTLKKNGVKEIVEAYDMDKYENEHVLNGSMKLYGILSEFGFKTRRMKWDANYKGIDDYLLARKQRLT